jgi:hypothetical protein
VCGRAGLLFYMQVTLLLLLQRRLLRLQLL